MANNLKTTTMAWGSPGRYIQGPGEITNLPKYTTKFGDNVFVVIDQFFYEDLTAKLGKLYEELPGTFKTVVFNTEVSEEQIA